jgi:hypothetical protein
METHKTLDTSSVEDTLAKLSILWKNRGAVNHQQPEYNDFEFDETKNDFCESLLPFRHHEAWRMAPDYLRNQILSYGWIIYNLKTIYVECDIVTPACEDIIKHPPSASSIPDVLQNVMSQTLLDEALHTRMSLLACNYIYLKRKIKPLRFRDFNLISWKETVLKNCTADWQRRLARFGIACASETLITDYLKVMSTNESNQKICHAVTKAHAADEWRHSSVFSYAAIDIVNSLTSSERSYLKNFIPETVKMFADTEMGAWATVFEMIDFPYYKDIVFDSVGHDNVQVYLDSANKLQYRIGLMR